MKHIRRGLAGAAAIGLVVTGAAAWAVPPVESEPFGFTADDCAGTDPFALPGMTFDVAADFAATVDGDDDVNVGDEVEVAFVSQNPVILPTFGDGQARFTVFGEELIGTIEAGTPADGAAVASVSQEVPADAAGSVIEARLDGFDGPDGLSCTTPAGSGAVSLYVNRAPEAADDEAVVRVDGDVIVDVLANDDATWDSGTVLSNPPTPDELAGQDDLSEVPLGERADAVTIVDGPERGTAEVLDDGRIAYEPEGGFRGDDLLTYRLTDNDGASDTAELELWVDDPRIQTLEIEPSAEPFVVGVPVTFTVFGIDQFGDAEDITAGVEIAVWDEDEELPWVEGAMVTFEAVGTFELFVGDPSSETIAWFTVEVLAEAPGNGDDDGGEPGEPSPTPPPAGEPGLGEPGAETPSGSGPLPGVGGPQAAWLGLGLLLAAAGACVLAKGRGRGLNLVS